MLAYVRTYQKAWALSRACLRKFDISQQTRLHCAAKASNLSMCFLGFSIHRGEAYFNRSAELGVLAAIFDLVSDQLKFDSRGVRCFSDLLREVLEPELAAISLDTLNRKKEASFVLSGLERGIPALRVIIRHLHAEESWVTESDVIRVGILCQIVDDVLDYRSDFRRDELNFLKQEGWQQYVQGLLHWDYHVQFRGSQYPLVLFYVVERAKKFAKTLCQPVSKNTWSDTMNINQCELFSVGHPNPEETIQRKPAASRRAEQLNAL